MFRVLRSPNGESRCPLIIISSTPRKAESEETPWYDRYDSEHGYVKYYGDNKPNKGRPENAPGNKIIHDKVYTTYTVFDAAGNRYVQIDTYGKIDRENPEKISQSIQFDKQTAEFFVDLLKKNLIFDEQQIFGLLGILQEKGNRYRLQRIEERISWKG